MTIIRDDLGNIPMPEPTREELLAQLASLTRNGLADYLVCQFQLVAMTRPEELRRAFAGVFDLRLLEEQGRKSLVILNELCRQSRQEVQQLRDEVAELKRDLTIARRQLEEPVERIEEEGFLDIRNHRSARKRGF